MQLVLHDIIKMYSYVMAEIKQKTVSPADKLFVIGKIPSRSIVSKVRYNREYLISSYVADELNTYRTWTPFKSFNDAYAPKYQETVDENGKKTGAYEEVDGDGPGAPAVRSIFNKAGSIMMGGSGTYDVTSASSEWRISTNTPLMDSPSVRQSIRQSSGCSVRELVALSENGYLGRATYSYSDFMYCKWLGKMPNTYLITLRRFPLPVDDYISSAGLGDTRSDEKLTSQNYPSIGCLVTWMGTPGNEMQNILKYSVSMPYTEKTAELQDVNNSGDANTGPFNAIAAAFDSTYREQYQQGMAGQAVNAYIGKMFPAVGSNPYSVSDFQQRDSNKVYGPVDTIKRTYMRSADGINFEQNMTLVFEYEMRSYNGINQRQAFLDLISNILNVTYTTGTFWGGGYRGVGAHQNNIFANLQMFKAKGGFSSFVDAFQQDAMTLSGIAQDKLGDMSLGQVLKAALNTLGGMLIGGVLNKLGRPAKQYTQSLLSPAPVGFWHVMIGNPNHPIISVGNMVLKNTTIEHLGPLGIDGFPTGLRVTCELTRGKPRDIRDIEKMYMKGNDRIYSSMSDKILDMYENAKEYKGGHAYTTRKATSQEIKESTNKESTVTLAGDTIITPVGSQNDIDNMGKVLMKYFGTKDTGSIIVVSKEQEDGSQRKASPTASGDSRQKGTGNGISAPIS